MASDNTRDWVCVLKKVNESAESVGFILKFSNPDPISALSSLPGFSDRATRVNIKSSYALVTCHHTISSLERLEDWTLFCPAFSQRERCGVQLGEITSECVTCCGEELGFIHSGKSTLHAHPGKIACDLDLNFTILFLNERFETDCLSGVGANALPPVVVIPQNHANLEYCQQALFGPNTRIADAISHSDDSHRAPQTTSCLQILCPQIKGNNEVCINAIPIEIIKPSIPIESSQPSLPIKKGISDFQKVRKVSFRKSPNHDSVLCPGAPIVYNDPATNQIETIAMYSGLPPKDGKPSTSVCVTIYGMMQLLQGGLIPSFAILRVPQAHRLWPHRWSHLLRPFIAQYVQEYGPVALLEMLVLLMEKEGGIRLIELSARDPPDARVSTLALITDVFNNFESLNEADVEQERLATSSVEVEFIVKGLCEALMDLLSNICGDTEIVKGQIEACFRCYRALLHFKHKDIIAILGDEKCLQYLKVLKGKDKSIPVLELLASIHKVCYDICRGVSRALSNENGSIKQDNDCLVSELAQNTTENEKHRARIAKLEQENLVLEVSNKKLLHKSLHHPAQIQQLQDQLTEKSCQLSSTCKELSSTCKERDIATEDAENKQMMLSRHTTSYEKKLDQVTELLSKRTADNDSLTEQLAEVTEQLSKQTEDCDTLREQLAQETQRLSKQTKDREKLKEQLAKVTKLLQLANSHPVTKRQTSVSESTDYRQPSHSAFKPCFTISSGSRSSKIPRRANSGEQRRYSDPKSQFVKSASESEIKKTAS